MTNKKNLSDDWGAIITSRNVNAVGSLASSETGVDAEDYSSVVEDTDLANGCCPGCGEKGQPFEGDHGSPKSRGGLGLQIICKACNRTKSDKFGFSKKHMRMYAHYRRAKKLDNLLEDGYL